MSHFATFSVNLRLPASMPLKYKGQTKQKIIEQWGKFAHIAVREVTFFDQAHQLGLMFMFFANDDKGMNSQANDILKWFDEQIEGWVEEKLLEKY